MEHIWIKDVINKELQEVLIICYLKNNRNLYIFRNNTEKIGRKNENK